MASLASLFVCGSAALRPPALRPQLKRDPLGGAIDDDLPGRCVSTCLCVQSGPANAGAWSVLRAFRPQSHSFHWRGARKQRSGASALSLWSGSIDLTDRHEFFLFLMSHVRPNDYRWNKESFQPLRRELPQ